MRKLSLHGGFRFSGKSEEDPIKNHNFCSSGRARLPCRLSCRYFSVYDGKGKTTTKCLKTKQMLKSGVRQRGGLTSYSEIKALLQSSFLRRPSRQAWVFSCSCSRLWLEVSSSFLDLNEPQKENILFPFFSTLHSLLPSLLSHKKIKMVALP